MVTPPVLFLIFNRPVTTARVFGAIRSARPRRLYVAADGPRDDRPGEAELCARARATATAVDWPCELRTLFREKNLGCFKSVAGALSWFFENEEEGLVLEDDCLPDPSFFVYAGELLARHRDDDRIMAICGSSYSEGTLDGGASYGVTRVFDPWGWATWKRAWALFDEEMEDLEPDVQRGILQDTGPNDFELEKYWAFRLRRTRDRRIDTWDYRWIYSIFKARGLVAYPSGNLISNIGFGPDAAHTVRCDSKLANRTLQSITLPLIHPVPICINTRLERDVYRVRYGGRKRSSGGRIIRSVKRLLFGP